MMTAQEVFDKVVSHLRQQGGKSLNAGQCVYRAPDGKKCAVGCLIEDEEYTPAIEMKGVVSVFNMIPSLDARIGSGKIWLLQDLQVIHDQCYSDDWESSFERLANERGLTLAPRS